MEHLWRAFRFLRALARPAVPTPDEETAIDASGVTIPLDLYPPAGRPPHPAVLICHGFLAEGRREIRMKRLAEAFRKAGFVAAVPSFPDAEAFRITTAMRGQIVSAARFLLAHPWVDARRVGIFGTSYAGTLGYLAASDPPIRDRVRWVGSLGAYHSLSDVLKYGLTGSYFSGGDPFPLPPDPYARRILSENFAGGLEESLRHPLLSRVSLDDRVELNPRLRIVLTHSERDDIVPHPEMERIARTFSARGLAVETFLFRGAAHARVGRLWGQLAYLRAAAALVRASG